MRSISPLTVASPVSRSTSWYLIEEDPELTTKIFIGGAPWGPRQARLVSTSSTRLNDPTRWGPRQARLVSTSSTRLTARLVSGLDTPARCARGLLDHRGFLGLGPGSP